MGVPAFFRWLSRKYPSVICHCIEEKAREYDEKKIPVDTSKPNPNGIEFDNLYLDMNGIIHPCTHPEDRPAPKNEDEMMVAIFEHIDRLFAIVRPRKVLYMAIDGVAPRAKMNQQRSRRFRASKETAEKVVEVARIRDDLESRGLPVPPQKPKGEHFDSNCITPGTPFMHRLSQCLHYYIHERLRNDSGWKNIKVILSDANVPGEGEHKIMDYIRRQRAHMDHDPNTRHVLCGADADLIMLGLATHEPHFTIIREEFKPNQPRPCEICGQLGHDLKDCQGLAREKSGEHDEIAPPIGAQQEYIFVRLFVLREYLARELEMPNLPFAYDLERAIDDWVFMCFFVGNDFLPHLPSLEIREGAIDRLVGLYKQTVYKTGGWVTDSGFVSLDRVQMIMTELGKAEDQIFRKRQQDELNFKARNKAKKRRMQGGDRPNYMLRGEFAPKALGGGHQVVQNARMEVYQTRVQSMSVHTGNMDAAVALKAMLKTSVEVGEEKPENSQASPNPLKRKREDDDSEDEVPDEVRLWEEGFKERYYESKFGVPPTNEEFRYQVAAEYVKGLCWVLQYYYQGCASWNWYFPYHYAPFASDFVDVEKVASRFPKGTQPFNPMEQLMGVFPAASRSHIPAPWAELMIDPASPIIDFYPEDFKIDLNGKKYAWQGVALLPFVDEVRLKKALQSVAHKLTEEERKRNTRGDTWMYVSKHHKGYPFLRGLYEGESDSSLEVPVDTALFQGLSGTVLLAEECVAEGGTLESPVVGLPDLYDCQVVCVKYRDPNYPDTFEFPARRLKGAINPPPVLKPQDYDDRRQGQWRPQTGMSPATQRASVGASGHRALGHYVRPEDREYGAVPPGDYGRDRFQSRSAPGGYGQPRYSHQGNQGRGGYYGGGHANGNNPNYQGGNRGGRGGSYGSYDSRSGGGAYPRPPYQNQGAQRGRGAQNGYGSQQHTPRGGGYYTSGYQGNRY